MSWSSSKLEWKAFGPTGLEQGWLLLLQKSQFCLAREVFFIGKRPKRQSRDFPHLMQGHTQFANRGEESPRSWAIQFKNGVKARHVHLNTVAGRPDGLVEVQPLQILLEMSKDVGSQIHPPRLRRVNPAWSPEVSGRVVPINLEIQRSTPLQDFLPLGCLATHSQDVDPLCNEEAPLLHNQGTEPSISLCGRSRYFGSHPMPSFEPVSHTGRKTERNAACWMEGKTSHCPTGRSIALLLHVVGDQDLARRPQTWSQASYKSDGQCLQEELWSDTPRGILITTMNERVPNDGASLAKQRSLPLKLQADIAINSPGHPE